MREIGISELLRSRARLNRVFFHNLWFREHNNSRMAALLPRLNFVDAFLVRLPRRRIPRGLTFRILQQTRILRYRTVLSLASARYPVLFTNGLEQARYFSGPVVVDMDDPVFSQDEVRILNLPNVARCVVTNDQTAARYREMGVRAPMAIIPQGVNLSGFDPSRWRELREQLKNHAEEVVAEYHAAYLLSSRDHGGSNPLYNVDFLLEAWEAIHREVPNARLWLIGEPRPALRRLVAGRKDILLLGHIPQAELPNILASVDVGLYPRRVSHVRRAVKVSEWLSMGVPVVGFDLPVLEDIRVSGAGILVADGREFVAAAIRLLRDTSLRRELAERAQAFGAGLDWGILARRYTEQVFGDLLPDA